MAFNAQKSTLLINYFPWSEEGETGASRNEAGQECSTLFTRCGHNDTVMNYLYVIAVFLAGGSIVAGTTYLANLIDPRYGGILAVAPIITTLSFLFTSLTAPGERVQELVMGSLLFLIPTILFLVALFLLLHRSGFALSILGAYGVWIVSVLVVARMAGLL